MRKLIPFLLLLLIAAVPVTSTYAQNKKDKIVMPEYPGGQAALHKFLLSELTYPEEARLNDEIGEVLVGFSVGMDGSVSGVRVLRSVSPSLDAEAVRVVKLMKYWSPGTRNGMPVRAEMSIPINFKAVKRSGKYINDDREGSDYTDEILKDIF